MTCHCPGNCRNLWESANGKRTCPAGLPGGSLPASGLLHLELGGFIVDGGHAFGQNSEKSGFRPSAASRGVRPPPVTARHDFPPDWRILLAIPDLPAGASGTEESDIFRTRCPVPAGEVRELCHEILMRMLPGLVEKDLDLFGSSVNAVQKLGFKKGRTDACSQKRSPISLKGCVQRAPHVQE